MKFTLIGTGAASGIPCYGCNCAACIFARDNPEEKRQKTSAMLEFNGRRLLFDANANDFATRFPYASYDAILLTHFHMDHVSALFDIRWGVGAKIPVYHPEDHRGADDLFKHSGLLNFQPIPAFSSITWQGAKVTPIPLNHSRPTFGYIVEYHNQRIAYLTDTAWLPEDTINYLKKAPITQLFLDTSHPPKDKQPRNHHDVDQAKQVFELINPDKMGLIHLSHDTLNWALDNDYFFDERFYLAHDGDEFTFNA